MSLTITIKYLKQLFDLLYLSFILCKQIFGLPHKKLLLTLIQLLFLPHCVDRIKWNSSLHFHHDAPTVFLGVSLFYWRKLGQVTVKIVVFVLHHLNGERWEAEVRVAALEEGLLYLRLVFSLFYLTVNLVFSIFHLLFGTFNLLLYRILCHFNLFFSLFNSLFHLFFSFLNLFFYRFLRLLNLFFSLLNSVLRLFLGLLNLSFNLFRSIFHLRLCIFQSIFCLILGIFKSLFGLL